jgi:LPS export ABC transporter protein LptC
LLSPKRIAKAIAGFGAVALVALLAVTIYVVRHRDAASALKTVAGIVPGSFLHVHNFHWTQMKGGAQQWVLTARDANYSDDKTSVILTDPVVTMTSSDGKPVTMQAPKAELKMDGNQVKRAHMSGGTQIHYGDFVLTTDDATFLPDADLFEAPGFVTINGDGIKVTGIGMTGYTKTRRFELLKQVTTQIAPRHGAPAQKKG